MSAPAFISWSGDASALTAQLSGVSLTTATLKTVQQIAPTKKIRVLGYNLVALSRDTCGSHRKYAVKKAVPFILASDPDDAFARAMDSIVEKTLYGRTYSGPARAAFVLATDGRVLAVVPKVDTKDHAAQLHAALAKL